MSPLQIFVSVLVVLVLVAEFVALMSQKHKDTAMIWTIIFAALVIPLALADAIARQSWWPVGQIVVMSMIIVLALRARKRFEIDRKLRREEMIRDFRRQERAAQLKGVSHLPEDDWYRKDVEAEVQHDIEKNGE